MVDTSRHSCESSATSRLALAQRARGYSILMTNTALTWPIRG